MSTSNLITNSRLKTARQCARLHQLRYVLGYRPTAKRPELEFGSLMHLALEAWWLAVAGGRPATEWLTAANAVLSAAPDVDPFSLVLAEVLMFGYDARWSTAALEHEVLGVEEQFEFPLVHPTTGIVSDVWRVGGRLDVRVRRRSDGSYGFIEHKTSSSEISSGSIYWQRLRMDSQVSVYFDGVESLGHAPEWCLYDVIGKPGVRPLRATPIESQKRKANGELYANQRAADETPEEFKIRLLETLLRTPERYFVRGEIVRLESELNESRLETWQQAAILLDNSVAQRHPRNVDACMSYGSVCQFFGVCSGEASLEDPALFTRSSNVHTELAAPSNDARGVADANHANHAT